mgnify:CR=1 FL=1
MKNVILIHGYNGIPKIYKYFEEKLKERDYNVIVPNFPTKTDITIDTYFKIFDENKKYFKEDCIVIAHSIGNEMFIKYICENNLKIGLYISLAGFGNPFIVEGREDLNNVIAPIVIEENEQTKCKALISKCYSIYSNNDHIVPFETLEKFPKLIGAKGVLIEGIGHMGKKSGLEILPQVIEIIDKNEKKGIQITNSELINIENIYQDIRNKIVNARQKMLKHIDTTMTEVYWYVGKITYELSENSTKASYGKKVIEVLSSKLTIEFGGGFSPVSIRRMRQFYEAYPIWSTVSTELSWAHYQELMRIDRKEERVFYEREAIKSNWGVRELRRQINTKLYDRYLISPNKELIIEESKKGLIEKQPEELLKSPYIFEFAGLKENKNYLETDLEKALLSHLTEFLLELGRGFSFVASQQRIKIGSEYYYPDLIFYNRLAKCFVIIDLKIGKLTHQDIGQMQMYVNYYKKTQMIDGENEPIGILLCADKEDAVVEMTLGDSVKNIYASKYLTYLPTKEELIKIIKDEKELYELANETKVGDNNE